MACDGNCGACKNPCSAANFMAKIINQPKDQPKAETNNNSNSKKECEKMSDLVKTAGCGAPSEPDHIRANAAIIALQKENEELRKQVERAGASTPLCFGIKNTTCLAILVGAIALGVAIYALSAVGKYAALIDQAAKNSTEAVESANQANATANKALLNAENAEKRAEKNYIYLRGLKHDLRGK